MTYERRARGAARRQGRRYGGRGSTAVVVRRNALRAGTVGLTALAVRGAHAAGASSINLDAPSVRGRLKKGMTFTIAGDGTTYTVTGNFTAAANRLDGVTFSPVLAANAADDAAVTVAEVVEFTFRDVVVSNFDEAELGSEVQGSDRKVILHTVGAPIIDVDETDGLRVNGEPEEIQRVGRRRSGAGDPIAIVLHVGARAA